MSGHLRLFRVYSSTTPYLEIFFAKLALSPAVSSSSRVAWGYHYRHKALDLVNNVTDNVDIIDVCGVRFDEEAEKDKGGEIPPIFRCDKLPTFMNPGKERVLRELLRSWRRAAISLAAIEWGCFYRDGSFDPLYDPATSHRRAGADVRRGILRQLAGRYELVVEENEKRRLPAMISGLVDPLDELKSTLGAAQVQMVRNQVMGTLDSFMSNRQNDFRSTVFQSTVDESLRHQLLYINKAKAWFDLKRELKIDDQPIPSAARQLARKIMSHLLQQHRRPRMHRIGMIVDQRVALLATSSAASGFDLWLRLSVSGLKGSREAAGQEKADSYLHIPLKSHGYFNAREGARKLSFQIIEDRNDGRISVGVITDIAETLQASRESYVPKVEALSLDFGLSTMFATNHGDLLGLGFLTKLKALDATITGIARHIQRVGGKPRNSKRYCQQVTRVRGFVETEINRVINQLIKTHGPAKLLLERLNFRSPELSRRMNRIVQNCGRSVLKAKLASIEQQYGITSSECVSAYTSQTCSCCGYTDKKNRKDQARFECLWCGKKLHADVNAARNVGSERFRSFGHLRPGFRSTVLNVLVSQHVERWPDLRLGRPRKLGAPSDPRVANPYFKDKPLQGRSLPLAA